MTRSSSCLATVAAIAWALFPTLGAGQQLDPATPPTFDSTSSEPVLLRYKMQAGQVLKMTMDVNMSVKVKFGWQELDMRQDMRIEAKAAITDVDAEGNISLVEKITRMTMKMSGLQEMEFDTDVASDNPALEPLTAMINVGIPCRVSPVGEILETDLEPLRLALRRADNAALLKSIEDSTSKMFEGTFVQLSEAPVQTGDTYKAGTLVEDQVKVHMSYKIGAISGDQTQLVLEPTPTLEAAAGAFPGADVTIRSQEVTGWTLFDLQNGCPGNGAVRMHMVFDVNTEGETGTMELDGVTTLTTTLE